MAGTSPTMTAGKGCDAAPRARICWSMTAAQKAQQSTPDVASAHEKILIVDFGSQVTQLIARRVREQGVYCEIVPFQKAEAAFREMRPKGVILSGGPESVHEAGSPRAPQAIFDSGVPVLGICYGQMTMAAQLGGEVEGGHHREFGRADVEVKAAERAVRFGLVARRAASGLDEPWRPHHQNAAGLRGGRHLGECAVRDHPGREAQILRADVPPRGGAHARRRQALAQFRRARSRASPATGPCAPSARRRSRRSATQVGKGRVICGLSGGVDSAVAAVLIHEAIGDQLTCVFVDHGLLRLERSRDRRRPVPASLQHPAGAC